MQSVLLLVDLFEPIIVHVECILNKFVFVFYFNFFFDIFKTAYKIKTKNIFLTRNAAKLGDFGIARCAQQAGTQLT